ncbi:hypothetical protein [Microcoleus sp. N9_A1]
MMQSRGAVATCLSVMALLWMIDGLEFRAIAFNVKFNVKWRESFGDGE